MIRNAQVLDQRLRMTLLLDVDGDDGDFERGGVLLVLPFPYELRIQRGVARVEPLRRRRLVGRDEPAQFLGRDVDARVLVLHCVDRSWTRGLLRLFRHGDGAILSENESRWTTGGFCQLR